MYPEAVSCLTRLGKDRRTVKLRKLLIGHSCEGVRLPVNLALQQSSNPGPAHPRSLNSAEFGHWLIVAAHDDHLTLYSPINVTREVGLGLLNVDFCHTLVAILARI